MKLISNEIAERIKNWNLPHSSVWKTYEKLNMHEAEIEIINKLDAPGIKVSLHFRSENL